MVASKGKTQWLQGQDWEGNLPFIRNTFVLLELVSRACINYLNHLLVAYKIHFMKNVRALSLLFCYQTILGAQLFVQKLEKKLESTIREKYLGLIRGVGEICLPTFVGAQKTLRA